MDELESLGKVSALPVTKRIKRQCPPSDSAVFLDPINSCYQLLPFPKALFQVLETGDGEDTVPFVRFVF